MVARDVLVLALTGACGRIDFDPIEPFVPLDPIVVGATNGDPGDQLGTVVALSADGATLAVGAYHEASAGDPADNSLPDAGAVYVFVRDGASWAAQAYLKASNIGPGLDGHDQFGFAVALSADGSLLAVGAPLEDGASPGIDGDQSSDAISAAGAVYLFRRTGTTWVQEAYVKASNPRLSASFGSSVALSADGSVLAVGASLESSAATGIDGDQTSTGASDSGAAYVFRHGAVWAQEAYVKASNTNISDEFGTSVALSGDGATLAVGAIGESSAATGVGGNQLDNTTSYAGAVYVYIRSGATWAQQAYVKAPSSKTNYAFGSLVALSGDGATLAASMNDSSGTGDPADITAPGSGAVVMFERAGAAWSQTAYVKATAIDTSDRFGGGFAATGGIALTGDGATLVACAAGDDSATTDPADDTASDAGACYRFARTGTSWAATNYIKAPAPASEAFFGGSVAIATDGTLAIGAPGANGGAGTVTILPCAVTECKSGMAVTATVPRPHVSASTSR